MLDKLLLNIFKTIGLLFADYLLYRELRYFIPDHNSMLFYGLAVLLLVLAVYSAKILWVTLREIPHFLYWLCMTVLDRNPGEYVFAAEAKRRDEAKKQWEASPEYAMQQKYSKILEDFYNNGTEAPELYCLLGREEGFIEGKAEGFKSTYDVAFKKGRLKAIADAASRVSSGGYSGSSGNKESSFDRRAREQREYNNNLAWRKSSQATIRAMNGEDYNSAWNDSW